MFDLEILQQLLEQLVAPRTVEIVAQLQDSENVLFYRQVAKYRGFLRQVADTEAGAVMP